VLRRRAGIDDAVRPSMNNVASGRVFYLQRSGLPGPLRRPQPSPPTSEILGFARVPRRSTHLPRSFSGSFGERSMRQRPSMKARRLTNAGCDCTGGRTEKPRRLQAREHDSRFLAGAVGIVGEIMSPRSSAKRPNTAAAVRCPTLRLGPARHHAGSNHWHSALGPQSY